MLNLIFICNIYIFSDFFLSVWSNRCSVLLTWEIYSQLGIWQNSLDLQGPEWLLVNIWAGLQCFGGSGKGYSIFKCLQTVRIDLWFFFFNFVFCLHCLLCPKENKFLTFLIVIRLVYFIFNFSILYYSTLFVKPRSLSFPEKLMTLDVCEIANLSSGLNG